MSNEETYILQKDEITQTHGFGCSVSTSTKNLIGPSSEALGDTSSLGSTALNYVNSIIGSGVIGIPFAIYNAGIGMGIILLFLVAFATDYSLCQLIRSGNIINANSYQELMEVAYGRAGYYLLTALQVTYPIIAMTSYNVIIGDTLPKIILSIFKLDPFSTQFIVNRYVSIFLATILFTLPLSLYRNVSRLSKASLMSLLLVCVMTVIFIIRAVSLHDEIPTTPDSYRFYNTRMVQAVGVMACAFMCQHNSFLLYSSLRKRSNERWYFVTHISIIASFFIIVIVGIVGFITFTGYSQGDILVNYCDNDVLVNCARLSFIGVVVLTFPIELFVTRQVIENIIFQGVSPSSTAHYSITIVIVTLIFIVSCMSRCLKIFLEINGILIAIPLAYIIPSLISIKINPGKFYSLDKIPFLLLITFGIIAICIGMYQVFKDMIDGIKCFDTVDLPYCSENATRYQS